MTTETNKTRKFAAEVPFTPVSGTFTVKKRGSASGPRERSDYQKSLDDLLTEHYAAQTPVFLETDATTEAVADLEKRIRNSAAYIGRGVRFGEEQASSNKGKIVLAFMVTEKRAYKPKKSAE